MFFRFCRVCEFYVVLFCFVEFNGMEVFNIFILYFVVFKVIFVCINKFFRKISVVCVLIVIV